MRFKVVSKQWKEIISDPRFAKEHCSRNRNKSPSGLFFYDPVDGSPAIKSAPLTESVPSLGFLDDTYKVVQSCNGLLLCCRASQFYVWNPTTRQSKELPQPEGNHARSCISSCTLAYDPCISLYYKVVRVSFLNKRRSLSQINVYSSEDNSWRAVAQNFQPKWPSKLESGTYWKEAIHWATSRGESIQFDLNSGILEYNPMPRSRGLCYRYFGQSCNSLHFAKLCGPSAKRFYLQQRLGDSWVNKYCVNVHGLVVSAFPEMAEANVFAFSLLSVVGGTELDTELVLRIPGKVISYNYWKDTVKELLDLPGEPLESSCVRGYQFVATLAPV